VPLQAVPAHKWASEIIMASKSTLLLVTFP